MKIKLKTRLLIAMLAVGLIPFGIISFISWKNSKSALYDQAFEKLVGVRELKKTQIHHFFNERKTSMDILMGTVATFRQEALRKFNSVQESKRAQVEGYFIDTLNDIMVVSENIMISEALDSFSATLDPEGIRDDIMYDFLEQEKYGKSMTQIKNVYGFEDVLLITKSGMVVYSMMKGPELSMNVFGGELENTALSHAFTEGMKGIIFADFVPWKFSDNRYISFVAAPVYKFGELAGAIIFKLNNDTFNTIVRRREGMGVSGETFLVGRVDGKTGYRSDSIVRREKMGDLITDPLIEKALDGDSGTAVRMGKTGKMEIIQYDPLIIPGLNWALITIMDLEEVIAPRFESDEADYFARYIQFAGYADLLLIHPEGHVFYSVRHDSDYGTNILTGEFSESGLGKLVRRTIDTRTFGFSDIEPYAPLDGKPAAFIARPVINEDRIEMIAALRLSTDRVNSVMHDRSGMGKTGETYLVGIDKKMRSDSLSDPETHSVTASFARPETGSVDTLASREALSGKAGEKLIRNFNGERVLSAYCPLNVWDVNWALIAEVHESEALSAVGELKRITGYLAMMTLAAVFLVALFFTRRIVKPLIHVMAGLSQSADQLRYAAEEIASNSQLQSQSASDQVMAVTETIRSLEEMSKMSEDATEMTRGADDLMAENIQKSGQSLKKLTELTREMNHIEDDSGHMSRIINTIDEIAFQTSLLALNAAIEAARAGESGAGFAVVADEVRNLARRSTAAADETQELLDTTITRVSHAARSIRDINEDFEGIIESATLMGEKTSAITEATREVKREIDQIRRASRDIEIISQQVAAGSEESAAAAEELSAMAAHMKDFVTELGSLVGGESENDGPDDGRPQVVMQEIADASSASLSDEMDGLDELGDGIDTEMTGFERETDDEKAAKEIARDF